MTRFDESGRIAEELRSISKIPRVALIERWTAAHGGPPPKGISRRLLEYSAAYRAQARAHGGLKPAVRRRLRSNKIPTASSAASLAAPRKSARLSPGGRLVRDWHGRTHTVEVVENGFRYDGETYRSLSKIAQAITGARWSGPRFFGL